MALQAHLFVFDELNMPRDFGYGGTLFDSSDANLKNKHGRGFLGTGNWNDEIQSLRVSAGIWKVYKDIDFFEGDGSAQFVKELRPGDQGNCPDLGFPIKWISSIKLLELTEVFIFE